MLFYKSILGKRIPYGLFACGPLAGPLPSMGGRKLYWSQIGSSKLSLSLSLSLSLTFCFAVIVPVIHIEFTDRVSLFVQQFMSWRHNFNIIFGHFLGTKTNPYQTKDPDPKWLFSTISVIFQISKKMMCDVCSYYLHLKQIQISQDWNEIRDSWKDQPL